MENTIDTGKMRNRLREQQKVLSTRIEVEREKAAPRSLANPDRADLAHDYALRSRRLSLLEQLEDQLAETEAALERIRKGTYGRCTACGKAILLERLEALPSASLCIQCQRKQAAEM